jgi:hypothetical protein
MYYDRAMLDSEPVYVEITTASGRHLRFEFHPDDEELWCGLPAELEENENYWERALAAYQDGPPIAAPTCAYLDSELSRDELEHILCSLFGM